MRRTLSQDGDAKLNPWIANHQASPATAEQSMILRRVEEFARRHGMRPIPPEYLCELVPEAELELAAPGSVTVYNCLFEDQDNFIPPIFCGQDEAAG
jgi:hypothetical protein